MKTNKKLKEMEIKELEEESEKHWKYSRKIDKLIEYKKLWEKDDGLK